MLPAGHRTLRCCPSRTAGASSGPETGGRSWAGRSAGPRNTRPNRGPSPRESVGGGPRATLARAAVHGCRARNSLRGWRARACVRGVPGGPWMEGLQATVSVATRRLRVYGARRRERRPARGPSRWAPTVRRRRGLCFLLVSRRPGPVPATCPLWF